MMYKTKKRSGFGFIPMGLFIGLVAGCGGGSGSGGSEANTAEVTNTDTASQGNLIINQAPVAIAGNDQNALINNQVTLNASESFDPDGDTLSYYWELLFFPPSSSDLVDSLSEAELNFIPGTLGTYSYRLTVSDGTESATDQVDIHVYEAGTDSTAGVLCDYTYDVYNSTSSVRMNSTARWSCDGNARNLIANGIPDHDTGEFPNVGNPNSITQQSVAITYSLEPESSNSTTEMGGPRGAQGYVLNGVKIDASTAGTCDDFGANCTLVGNTGTWNIEALGQSSFNFGTDDNNAHVQPNGAYHYHGMPEGFIQKQGGDSSKMTLIGWAADGFPIYARYGYSNAMDSQSELKNIQGSYQLISEISSRRPSVNIYALGTFSQDWEYVAGSGDLDECNGRFGVTPEFPNGIYHYYATDNYPYFQRCVTGEIQ